MSPKRMKRRLAPLVVAIALLGAFDAPASAQSLLANRGLGWAVQPADARGRGMGGIGVGLLGGDLSWANPADAVGMPAPGLKLGFQYDDLSADFDGRSAEASTARFPMLLAGFPVGQRGVITVGAAGFLDQNWAVEQEDTLFIENDTVRVLDRFTSEGGVTQLRLGGGYRLIEGLSVGAGLDAYVGGVARVSGRIFPGEITPRCCRAEWTYSGFGGVMGLEWSPNEALAIGGSVSLGGTLEGESDDTLATNVSFDIPVRASVGASGRVAGNLLVALAGDWAGWGTLNDPLAEVGGARDAWSVSGGLEWEGASLVNRPLPLRLGLRQAALPFGWGQPGADPGWVDERAVTGGLGLVLANGAVRGDLAIERGGRGSGDIGFEESFWRMSFSVNVLGR